MKDIVRANIMAMESDVANEVFNVGTGTSTTIKELAYSLMEIAGKKIEPVFQPRNVIVSQRRADVSKAKKLLGFEAKTGIREGFSELLDDMKAHPDRY